MNTTSPQIHHLIQSTHNTHTQAHRPSQRTSSKSTDNLDLRTCRPQLTPSHPTPTCLRISYQRNAGLKIKTFATSAKIQEYLIREPVPVHAHTHAVCNAITASDQMDKISAPSATRAGTLRHDPSKDHQRLRRQKRYRSIIRMRRRSVQCSRPSFLRSYWWCWWCRGEGDTWWVLQQSISERELRA